MRPKATQVAMFGAVGCELPGQLPEDRRGPCERHDPGCDDDATRVDAVAVGEAEPEVAVSFDAPDAALVEMRARKRLIAKPAAVLDELLETDGPRQLPVRQLLVSVESQRA